MRGEKVCSGGFVFIYGLDTEAYRSQLLGRNSSCIVIIFQSITNILKRCDWLIVMEFECL